MPNKRLYLFISLAFILILAACSGSSNETAKPNNENNAENDKEETITLKFADSMPKTHIVSAEGSQFFMERVTELTNGRVQFEHYPSEQIGKASDFLQLTKSKVTDIAYFATPYYPSAMPLSNGLGGLPGEYDDSYVGSMAFYDVATQNPILENDFLKNGVRPLTTIMTPTYEIFTKGDKIVLPKDLKGKSIRGSGGTQDKALASIGAVPVSTPAAEVYEAFERGVLDVVPFSYSSVQGYSIQEIANFSTKGVGFAGGSIGFFMNEEVFQSLPKDIQDIFIQVGKETTENLSREFQKREETLSRQWEEEGILEIYELTEEEKKVWKESFSGFAEEWAKTIEEEEGLPGMEVLKMYREALERQK